MVVAAAAAEDEDEKEKNSQNVIFDILEPSAFQKYSIQEV